MRRIKRTTDFEVTLEITNDSFVRPPRETQRNWLVNRALKEFADDLVEVDKLSSRFVQGAPPSAEFDDRTNVYLDDSEIMEDWQIPIMKAMSDIVGRTRGDVLEIGFGRGVSATMIQDHQVASHTIVECNEHVIKRYHDWRLNRTDRDIRLIVGKWQDVIGQFEKYDGIFFHAYPLHAEEFFDHVVQTVTFAEPFFEVASKHLRSGGVFTYLSNEYDSLGRGHQRELFRYFRQINLTRQSVVVPQDTKDALWGDSLMLVEAIK